MKSLSEAARSILIKESDDPTPDRDAKLSTPNKDSLRPGAKAVEGRFANPGANSPGEGEYEDLGPAAVNPTDVPPSAKAAGAVNKDNSKSAQSAVPAEKSGSMMEEEEMEEELEISEELEAFINQMMEEGYSEDEISEAIAENFEIVEEKDDDDDDDDDEKDVEEIDEDELNEISAGKLLAAAGKAGSRASASFDKVYSDRNKDGSGNMEHGKVASHYAGMAKKFSDAADKKSGPAKGPSAAVKRSAMKEHVDALLAGENLSEDFRAKAETLFESAVTVRVNEEVAVLEEAYQQALEEEVNVIMTNLTEQVDGYLGYVVEQWMKENEIAIEAGLRTEITEEFISGLKTLFAENYIDIPTEKVSVTEELGKKVESLQAQLNEEIERSIALSSELVEAKKFESFALACEGLTAVEAEKLRTLSEGIEASSADEFANKLHVIKESYFSEDAPVKKGKSSGPLDLVEDNGAGSDERLTESMSGPMSAYVRTLDRSLVKTTNK